jgi:hypothetical protein
MLNAISLAVLVAGSCAAELPKVERDWNVIGGTKQTGQTAAALIPPDSVKRILLTSTAGLDDKTDPDELMARFFASPVKGEQWGLRDTERTAAEFLILTKGGEAYRAEAVYDVRAARREVTAVLLYGKGFACRFDLGRPEKP